MLYFEFDKLTFLELQWPKSEMTMFLEDEATVNKLPSTNTCRDDEKAFLQNEFNID